jgi:hypothetical protein
MPTARRPGRLVEGFRHVRGGLLALFQENPPPIASTARRLRRSPSQFNGAPGSRNWGGFRPKSGTKSSPVASTLHGPRCADRLRREGRPVPLSRGAAPCPGSRRVVAFGWHPEPRVVDRGCGWPPKPTTRGPPMPAARRSTGRGVAGSAQPAHRCITRPVIPSNVGFSAGMRGENPQHEWISGSVPPMTPEMG